ncbi:SDR family oxidoreductase [Neobacillus sp. PS3-12]|uniref:SDR family oxidoreductase n=1 Tax=Neobacillus sp. PS3-12 TaxID=3070677 RepID=UPI0027E193A5|nr:SDR family oxidoreductase [Neobacillus sp. PS3-12]WML51112.1 SDR family oxidoreductase [Neobacillus sp. PS3-12]
MKHVVITGSTRGIGFGLATEFLKAGCKVTINGTTQESVDKALINLQEYIPDNVIGFPARVEELDDVEKLWDYSQKHFGKVDIWINNAGIDQDRKLFWEMGQAEYEKVIRTNLLGVLNGSNVAFRHMLEYGDGQIFNMEGFGSNGMMREKMTIYGTSKSAISYFTRSLALEAKNTNVKVGTLSPGMVATDFLRKSLDEQNRKIYNILGDKVEPVTQFLAKRILNNQKNGANIQWLTKPKVMWRFMSSPFVKRDIFN